MSVSRIGLTTIRVTWNANWSNRFTTSRIYYQRLGTSGIASKSVDWWANSTDIGGLMGGVDYSIYIAHTASNPNTVRAAAKFTIGIRASVDALCRDGADEISRDPRRKRLKPRRESLAKPLKLPSNCCLAHL